MVSKATVLSWHGFVWVVALGLALWAGCARAENPPRFNPATPHTPYNRYKYIPVHSNYNRQAYEPEDVTDEDPEPPQQGMSTSELILTGLRTVLDVVRNINKQRSSRPVPAVNTTAIVHNRRRQRPRNSTAVRGRGFDDYSSYDEHDHHHHETTTTPKPVKQGRYTDPWAGYYDWIINEGSFKFWSVFQLFTAALLLYACLSAIYYAKFNPILPDYSMEYDDYFLERTIGRKARSLDSTELPSGLSWINPQMFQFIMNAISKHYEEE